VRGSLLDSTPPLQTTSSRAIILRIILLFTLRPPPHPVSRGISSLPLCYLTIVASRTLISTVLTTTRKSLVRSFFNMPPKQATLGYVKDPQTTLGCVCSRGCMRAIANQPILLQQVLWEAQRHKCPAEAIKAFVRD
jgi:hypothetical protein